MSLSAVFTSDKAPWIFTAFVAALGFVLSQSLARFDRTPIIEYSLTKGPPLGDVAAVAARRGTSSPKQDYWWFSNEVKGSKETGFVLRLENIATATVARCAKFQIAKTPIPGDNGIPVISEGLYGTDVESLMSYKANGDTQTPGFTVIDMQPGASIELRLNTLHTLDLVVIATGCSDGDAGPGRSAVEPPLIFHRSVRTYLLKFALPFLWICVAVWSAFMLFAIIAAYRRGASGE